MRYLVYGAGAVGASLGGMLQLCGREVVFVARGAQRDSLARAGLTLASHARTDHLRTKVVGDPSELEIRPSDVILLCVKSQDTRAALDDLRRAGAPRDTAIVCAQNGVSNETLASELLGVVYGMAIFAPLELVAPGHVALHGRPVFGDLAVGVHPVKTDHVTRSLVVALREAGFAAQEEPRIQRLKYGKLLANLGNALYALTPEPPNVLLDALHTEALACYAAAGVDYAPLDELARRPRVEETPIDGKRRGGSSTWQSLARATGSIETDHLNGEIVRLGVANGVATPINRAVVAIALRAAVYRWPPGSLSPEELSKALKTNMAAG